MAKGNKYYWIKLKTSFLTSEKVDFLLSQKNGACYVVIYQMLCLKTINTNGELISKIGEVMIPYDINKIQRDLKHFDVDTIRVALELYKQLGMIYEQESGVFKITEFNELIGSETDYAAQKRRQRIDGGHKVDKGVDNVHIEYRDKSIDIRDKRLDIDLDNIYNLFSSFIIIKDRYVEAGTISKERGDQIEMMMKKSIQKNNFIPKTERLQDLLNCLIDKNIANEQKYIDSFIKNERLEKCS